MKLIEEVIMQTKGNNSEFWFGGGVSGLPHYLKIQFSAQDYKISKEIENQHGLYTEEARVKRIMPKCWTYSERTSN